MVPKVGRPSSYTESKCNELINLMSQGMLDIEVAAKWSISRDTFYEWLKTHDELREAYQQGLVQCEAWYLAKCRERLLAGDDRGYKYFRAIVDAKFGWSGDKQVGTKNTQINIQNMQINQGKSEQELIDYIVEALPEIAQNKLITQDAISETRTDSSNED